MSRRIFLSWGIPRINLQTFHTPVKRPFSGTTQVSRYQKANNRLHLLLCMYYQTCWTALGPDCEYPLGQSIQSSMFYTLHTHPINDPFPGLPRWAGTRKVKPIWILLEQETVSGSGISWAICKSAPHSSTPALQFFYRPDALPAAKALSYTLHCV